VRPERGERPWGWLVAHHLQQHSCWWGQRLLGTTCSAIVSMVPMRAS
jgi:hypothetical protein